jgi:cytoskeletal protein RodZ
MNSRSRRHGKAKSQSEASQAPISSIIRGAVPVLVGAIAIVGIGLWFAGMIPPGGQDETAAPASSAQSSSQGHAQTLPQFLVAAAPRVRAAYDFASGHATSARTSPATAAAASTPATATSATASSNNRRRATPPTTTTVRDATSASRSSSTSRHSLAKGSPWPPFAPTSTASTRSTAPAPTRRSRREWRSNAHAASALGRPRRFAS